MIIKKARRLNIPTKKKGQIVYSEKTTIKIKGKEYTRYRDARGQFTSIKK